MNTCPLCHGYANRREGVRCWHCGEPSECDPPTPLPEWACVSKRWADERRDEMIARQKKEGT